MSTWGLLLILMSLLSVLAVQGMKQNRKVAHRRYAKETTPYGPMYVELYDALLWNPKANAWEVAAVRERADRSSHVLDVGCGTGHLVASLSKYTDAVGVDSAPAMISRAKKMFPDLTFVEADAAGSADPFHAGSFTHVLCFGNTMWYMPRKDLFFANAAQWLQPGGVLFVGTGNNPGTNYPFRPGDVAYKGRWENERVYVETITYKGTVRTVKHKFYPETEATVLLVAKNAGFVLEDRLSNENGTVLLFRKSNGV
jgi:SAM-dependent methyltransferase